MNYPKAPFGWKLIFTKETGWTSPELEAATVGAVLIEDKTWPVAEYPGWVMTLSRSITDPRLWVLIVGYAPDGKTMSPDTLAVFVCGSTEQPQMPVSFSWGTTKWLLLGAGVAVLAVVAVVMWKRRKVRPRRRVARQLEAAPQPLIVQ